MNKIQNILDIEKEFRLGQKILRPCLKQKLQDFLTEK
ncbi:hypothetical protein K7I13_04350 [Brucepastera parasyntrophica]|nr:hypothetical protein [Brucepastera parasyntrophica]ULQ61130.1 hypothetical protein K7I13_04350 [Brucepastera parasyntrophica]